MIKKITKQILSTIISFVKILLYSKINSRFKLNGEVQNNKCVVLANGPSLNKNIESFIPANDLDYFAVNFFALSEHFFRLMPSRYVFADSAFWEIEENMHQETIKQREILLEKFKRVDWEMTIFVPIKGANSTIIKDLINLNHNLSIATYNTSSFIGFEAIKNWTFKQNLCMPLSQNVLIAALYLAINIGYRYIEVYGGDFSWTKSIRVDTNNIVCQIDSHFYNEKDVKLSPVLGYVGKPYRMHQYLGDLAKMFVGCWQVRCYADYIGVEIINKNKESFIDAFRKE